MYKFDILTEAKERLIEKSIYNLGSGNILIQTDDIPNHNFAISYCNITDGGDILGDENWEGGSMIRRWFLNINMHYIISSTTTSSTQQIYRKLNDMCVNALEAMNWWYKSSYPGSARETYYWFSEPLRFISQTPPILVESGGRLEYAITMSFAATNLMADWDEFDHDHIGETAL